MVALLLLAAYKIVKEILCSRQALKHNAQEKLLLNSRSHYTSLNKDAMTYQILARDEEFVRLKTTAYLD